MKFHSYTSRTKTKILNPIKSLKIQCFLSLRQRKMFFFWCIIVCLKLLTQLRFGFSHLNKHKCLCDFKGTVNPIYSCGSKIESTEHCLLCCQNQGSLRYL